MLRTTAEAKGEVKAMINRFKPQLFIIERSKAGLLLWFIFIEVIPIMRFSWMTLWPLEYHLAVHLALCILFVLFKLAV